jgi:uncharacterized membrane-anchored protein
VKLHRAIMLAVMLVIAVALVGAMTAYGIATFDGQSLASLLVVIAAAAVAGIAFSYRRYFPRRSGGNRFPPQPPSAK